MPEATIQDVRALLRRRAEFHPEKAIAAWNLCFHLGTALVHTVDCEGLGLTDPIFLHRMHEVARHIDLATELRRMGQRHQYHQAVPPLTAMRVIDAWGLEGLPAAVVTRLAEAVSSNSSVPTWVHLHDLHRLIETELKKLERKQDAVRIHTGKYLIPFFASMSAPLVTSDEECPFNHEEITSIDGTEPVPVSELPMECGRCGAELTYADHPLLIKDST